VHDEQFPARKQGGPPSPPMKARLDKVMVESGLVPSRQKAQALIIAGRVMVNGHRAEKPGSTIDTESQITIKGDDCPYVSRGGLKLARGLEYFRIDPAGFVCADIGASTGGFTDCLLQNGAARVFAVDVGYGQLAWSLRTDKRVVVMERTNARNLQPGDLPETLDLAVIDAAFISLRLLIPPLLQFFPTGQATIIALIKPQFEVGRGKIGKGGVVRDPALHEEVVREIVSFCEGLGLCCRGVTESPILGPKGNKEFVACFQSGHRAGATVKTDNEN